MKEYILATSYGAYIEETEDKQDLNFMFTSLANVKKYTKSKILAIRERHQDVWKRDKIEIHKVSMTSEKVIITF